MSIALYTIAVGVSACSLAYQFLLVKLFTQSVPDEVLCQSFTLGFYLVFMGVGTAISGRFLKKNPLLFLFRLEILLSLLGILLLAAITCTQIALELSAQMIPSWLVQNKVAMILLFQGFTAILGLLTGLEVPSLSAHLQSTSRTSEFVRVLAFTYFGAILGSIGFSLYLAPHTDLLTATTCIGFLNLLCATLLHLVRPKTIWQHLRGSLVLISCAGVLVIAPHFLAPLLSAQVKSAVLEFRLKDWSLRSVKTWWRALDGFAEVERHYSPFQVIDLVPDHFLLGAKEQENFALFINGQIQFTRSSVKGYHESMVFGAFNLHGEVPRKALVLGGGDGLIAAQLLRAGVQEITQVELDPMMIQLARQNASLRNLNENSFGNPKVKIIIDDAFKYILKDQEEWDAIFLDFPFPTNYDLTKLYSVEFYQRVRKRLSANGFLVFDAPAWVQSSALLQASPPFPQDIFLNTLYAAEFPHPVIFGPKEPFYYASRKSGIPQFDYEKVPLNISGRAIFNFVTLSEITAKIPKKTEWQNHLLRPMRIKW